MAKRSENYERSAAGMDFDSPLKEKASQLGSKLAEDGPEAVFEEIENLLPEPVREQVINFPFVAILAGVGAGVWLGMKKGDEILAAGMALVTAAAMSNVASVMDNVRGDDDE
jgi:hypothetical protein